MERIDELLNVYIKYFDTELPISNHIDRKNIADICMITFIEKFCMQYMWTNYGSVNYIARALLITLLETDNDLEKVFGEHMYFPFKPSSFIKEVNEDNVIHSAIKVDNKLSQTKRECFQRFLFNCKDTYNMSVVPNYSEKGLVYYIPYPNAVTFTLTYIYLDIKTQEDKKYRVLQKRKRVDLSKVFTGDENTLKILLLKILNVLGKYKKSERIEDRIFEIYQLKNIDRNYSFFKVNKMVQRMEEIKVESTFEKIYERFDLKYKEVTKLEEIFNEEIFYNDKFIEYCLKTNYHDPLFIFSVVLESTSKHYFDIMNDPMKDMMFNSCWQKNYLKANAKYKIFERDFSFREYLIFCRNLTIHKINSLINRVNKALEIENNKKKLCFRENPKYIRFDTINFYEKYILNFAVHKEEMIIEDFDYYNHFYTCYGEEEYHYVYASKHWDEYYFSNRERLENYAFATIKDEKDYMTYLFSKVIDSLPKYEKYSK